ncbi:MAG: amino acid ABC transporter permease [Scytonema sp. PMC 1069.18]|nr:amino acid ABC transporter permease [Scytonema sp. PMC 1069.18]MEC4886120.1 amino acid ABC transporter permease [Scytonema sp. PMC 1070.18]
MKFLRKQNPTILQWLRKNLFNTWYNSILTVICLLLLVFAIKGILTWVFVIAQWKVIKVNLALFLVGRYPQDLYWRLWLALCIILGLTGVSWLTFAKRLPPKINTWLPFGWALSFPIILWLIGGSLGLQPVDSNLWNGLLLTLITSIFGIVLSFPLGVLLALGRQSQLPVIRWLSILYIEIVRGLPLIGILFLAQVMIPLFLPPEIRLDRVLRGIAGLILFSAAYLAENVRGGLQSIPRGQYEAAKALGFNALYTMLLIILPQALRAVIPPLVGQFIGLFKDTSLLAIVGLLELTGIARSILAQPEFLNRYAEVYLFVGLIYWVFCYSMSLASRKLEKEL